MQKAITFLMAYMIEIPKEHKTGYSERGIREGSETIEINPVKESEMFIKTDQCTKSTAESIPLIFILVKENSSINEKYMSLKKEYRVLSSKHETELKKANQREEVLKEIFLDLKTRPEKQVDLNGDLSGLDQMTHSINKESQQNLKSGDLCLESKPRDSGDLQKSYVCSDLMRFKVKNPGPYQTGSGFDTEPIGNFLQTRLFSLNFISILSIILLSVFGGLIIGRSY